ncbi:MAG: TetR/AcrR family transcriptional regulator [Chloroflexota bacterium]
MKNLPQNATRERIMDAAESLFMKKGFSAVKIQHIAEAVNMRHASLYYYVPKGKEQLFIAVLDRTLQRHKHGMAHKVNEAGDDLQAQAYAVSDWLISQPPIDMLKIYQTELRKIDPAISDRMVHELLDALTIPFANALEQAKQRGEITAEDVGTVAMSLITLVQSVHHIPSQNLPMSRQAFGRQLTDMLLFGIFIR